MENSLSKLKKSYNNLIAREKKAQQFFNNPDIEQKKKDNWMPEYIELIKKLSLLMGEYKELTGEEMTEDEIFNGFWGGI
jgi:hypothetical protein